ncbi:MAG: sigma-70 family RNA polymerase sigma factor [Aureliella sp.]
MSLNDHTGSAEEFDAQMRAGSKEALAELFSQYRDRLKRIVQFRLDYRLAGRISESDVLQDAYVSAASRLEHFGNHPEMSPFLWLRLVVGQQLVNLYRQHIETDKRDIRKEVSIQAPAHSAQTSIAIAAKLIGSAAGASEIVAQAERIERLELTLNDMDSMDREVIALRHFEELSNAETATVLGIQPAAASKRYIRAMSRLAQLMREFH